MDEIKTYPIVQIKNKPDKHLIDWCLYKKLDINLKKPLLQRVFIWG